MVIYKAKPIRIFIIFYFVRLELDWSLDYSYKFLKAVIKKK